MNKYFENVKNAKVVLVHGAEFHADDVFFVALATLINPKLKIERSLDLDYIHEKLSDSDYLIGDIGDGRYDHHLPDSPVRETGRKYASFGLLWRDVGADICGSEEVANKIDRNFISIMDANDNGDFKSFQYVYTLIRNFRASWDDPNYETTMEENFLKAVEFARTILVNMIRQEVSIARGMDTLEEIYSSRDDEYIKEGIIVMPSEIPQYKNWALTKPDIRWIIFPTLRGHSIIQLSDHFPGKRNPIPEEYWIGNDPNNEKGILPDGIVFCHKTGYMMASKDLDSAINAVKKMNTDVEKEFIADIERYTTEHVADIFNRHGKILRWHPAVITTADLKNVLEAECSSEGYPKDIQESIRKVMDVVLSTDMWMCIYREISNKAAYAYDGKHTYRERLLDSMKNIFGSTDDTEFKTLAAKFRDKVRDLLGMSESMYEKYMERREADAHLHAVLMDIKNSGGEEEE